MDKDKIINLNIEQSKLDSSAKINKQSFLHTNPLLKKMFTANVLNNNKKFTLKDLFR